MAWLPKGRRIFLNSVVDPSGVVYANDEEAAEGVRSHWQEVFDEKILSLAAWATLLPFIKKFEVCEWLAEREALDAFLAPGGRSRVDSGPGPDGIPYSVYGLLGGRGLDLMYSAYLDLLDYRQVPDGFCDALLALLPKGEKENDAQGAARSARDIRPLSLGNTDAKMVAFLLAVGFFSLQSRLEVAQKCVKGRSMALNVLQIESAGMVASVLGQTDAAMVFLDFEAAFP